nr:hypothetical protein CFP56_54966 [Quercus suber]POF24044.1 hypothetical protein CFP56_54980 [Quercus suber]
MLPTIIREWHHHGSSSSAGETTRRLTRLIYQNVALSSIGTLGLPAREINHFLSAPRRTVRLRPLPLRCAVILLTPETFSYDDPPKILSTGNHHLSCSLPEVTCVSGCGGTSCALISGGDLDQKGKEVDNHGLVGTSANDCSNLETSGIAFTLLVYPQFFIQPRRRQQPSISA